MSKKSRNRGAETTLPRREVVEVFKTMRLHDPAERERLVRLGEYGQPARQKDYYSIEVTGTVDGLECR